MVKLECLASRITCKETNQLRKGQKQRWKGQRKRKVVKVSCPLSRHESKIPRFCPGSRLLLCVCNRKKSPKLILRTKIDRLRVKLFHLCVSMQPCSLEITMEYEAMRQVQSVSVCTSTIVAVGFKMFGMPFFQHVGHAIFNRL